MRLVLSLWTMLVGIGCAAQRQHVGLTDVASIEAEPHAIWTRPLEVGFEMGRYIEAESTQRELFGCVPLTERITNASVPALGAAEELTPAAKYTVSTAVKEAGADGMYILFVEESVQWRGVVKETTTYVKGRSLKLEDFGAVDQERATRVRVEQAAQGEVIP